MIKRRAAPHFTRPSWCLMQRSEGDRVLGFKKVSEAVVRQHDKKQKTLGTSLRDPFLGNGEKDLI